jgi:hypothetical protein
VKTVRKGFESQKESECEPIQTPSSIESKLPLKSSKKRLFLMKEVAMNSVSIYPVKMKDVRMKNVVMK